MNPKNFRVGIGYDVHAFSENRELILGGIQIPFNKGLKGHSDADVLTHSIIDALLGASAMGDIGRHFPDTDTKFKGIRSLVLLADIQEKLKANNWQIINVDSIIICQMPKMAPFIEQMKESIAGVLGIDLDQINIKATTTEMLGFTGRGEGISVKSISLIYKSQQV